MKGFLLCVALFLLWPSGSSQEECNEPDDIDFGEIVSDKKAKYFEDDRVQYKCNSGYLLEGSELIFCNGQEWTPPPPKCLAPCIITKQQLARKGLFLLGGQRKNQAIQSNHTLQFWCSKGYMITGSSTRMCVDGHMDLPFCISEQGQSCTDPLTIENGEIITLSEKQYRTGSSVEYKCQQYYAMEGPNRSFCDDGTWTNVPTCLDPCRITRAELESQKIEVKGTADELENIYIPRGSSIKLTCKTGYSLARYPSQSVFEFHCDGTLPQLPLCKEIQCLPPQVINGSFQPMKDQYNYNEEIQLECDHGFSFQGQGNISRCTQTSWEPPAVCHSWGCEDIRIKNGKVAVEFLLSQRIMRPCKHIVFRCNPGYLTDERKKYKMITYPKIEPKCFKTCSPSFRFQHGQFIHYYQSTFIEGDKIMLSCNEGYYPAGQQQTAICTEDGWSPTPRCLQTGERDE